MIVIQGTTAIFHGRYRDGAGGFTDPSSPSVAIHNPSDVVVATGTAIRDDIGLYHFDYPVAVDAVVGDWSIHWFGVIQGADVEGQESFTVAVPGSITVAGPQPGPCFPWTTASAVRAAVSGIDPNADLTAWIDAASQVLYMLTGRQFKGLCRATIRPGHTRCSCGGLCSAHAWGWPFFGGYGPYGVGGWYGGFGWWGAQYRSMEGPRNTLLCASEIDLGHEARSVESIKISGSEIDPTTWRLDPLGKLVRQPDASGNQLVWPCCSRVDVPSGSPGTFEITYVYGEDPPASVVMAVNVLAGQFWLGSNAGTAGQCKLPAHMQTLTRQGVTATFITDVTTMLEKGYTGLPLVDVVIRSVNPHHLDRRSRVISIDIESHRRMSQ